VYWKEARTAEAAWHEALGWLRDFRQVEAPAGNAWSGQFARAYGVKPGDKPRPPGRSHWPEPDKIRQLLKCFPSEHKPRYNDKPAWPRANFGLPIQFKFKQESRWGPPYAPPEPGGKKGFMLLWSEGGSTEHDRLASALLVKALPLAGGGFAPMALWLSRQLPPQARVFLKDQQSGHAVPNSEAPFTRLLGEGDTALYEPLRQKDLRAAFFHWLRSP
jgi:CRISPR-associated protein Cmr1